VECIRFNHESLEQAGGGEGGALCGSSAGQRSQGSNAAHINELYKPVAEEGVRGKHVYKMDGADTWI
jgi:hypothetical protein